jgi:hypothetical protein
VSWQRNAFSFIIAELYPNQIEVVETVNRKHGSCSKNNEIVYSKPNMSVQVPKQGYSLLLITYCTMENVT